MDKTVAKIMLFTLVLLAASGCGAATTVGRSQPPGTEASSAAPAARPADYATQAPESQTPGSQHPSSTTSAAPTSPFVSNTAGVPPSTPPVDVSAPGMVGGVPGAIGAGGASGAPPQPPPVEWLTYADKAFGFSISYPDTFVVLDKPNPRETPPADLVHQVRFQDRMLAAGGVAGLEPPQLRIEVFDNSVGRTLDQWLGDHQVAGARAATPIGDQMGIQVTLDTMMAPNQFYYTAHGQYIYRLTPLGPYGVQMLSSFNSQD